LQFHYLFQTLCRSIAIPLKKLGIKACAVCPEFVDTPLVRKVIAQGAQAARAMMGRDIDHVALLTANQVRLGSGT
jgi:NAD(P)-dependent dehydrogenase (short-subunit alcohol dehydrogenase family)